MLVRVFLSRLEKVAYSAVVYDLFALLIHVAEIKVFLEGVAYLFGRHVTHILVLSLDQWGLEWFRNDSSVFVILRGVIDQ